MWTLARELAATVWDTIRHGDAAGHLAAFGEAWAAGWYADRDGAGRHIAHGDRDGTPSRDTSQRTGGRWA